MDNNANSPKPRKEILPVDVTPDKKGTDFLANIYINEGWELFAPPQWDSVAGVWRVLVWRDEETPAPVTPTPPPTTRIIAEATKTVVTPPVVIESPAPDIQATIPTDGAGESADDTPLEEDTPAPAPQPPVIVVMPTLFPSPTFEDELRRIRQDKTLSPKEKIEAIKQAGDTIALNKARQAGESAYKAWNALYPTSPNFRFLPEGVKA